VSRLFSSRQPKEGKSERGEQVPEQNQRVTDRAGHEPQTKQQEVKGDKGENCLLQVTSQALCRAESIGQAEDEKRDQGELEHNFPELCDQQLPPCSRVTCTLDSIR
jgi:hypothetical protein